jgi:hypothetical protein
MIILIGSLGMSSAEFGTSLDNGLVIYYPMDEFIGNTSMDAVGTNNLIMQSSSMWQGGKLFYSIGNNNTIYNANSSNAIGTGQTTFGYSISFWVYKTGTTPYEYTSYLRMMQDPSQTNIGNCEWSFGEYGFNQSTILFGANTVDSWADTTSWRNWTHYVLTYTNGGNMKVYRNGVNVKDSTATRTNCGLQNTTSPLKLFLGTSSGYSPTKEVFLDEIAIWNRGLNSTEIEYLYGVIYKYPNKFITNSNNYTGTFYETETGNEFYEINISPINTYIPTNASFVYNGTVYPITIYNISGYYIMNKTLSKSSISIGSNNFYYTFNLSTTLSANTTIYTQTKSPIQFGLCNGTLTVPYLNISFKDEGTLNNIKGSIPSSTFTYYLGDGTINKTLTFVNTTTNSYYTFCSLPASKTYYIKPYVQYKNDTSYPQRIWDDIVSAYTNVTTNKTLYLLDSSDGIYVTYQVLDAIGDQISGVLVTINRTIEGTNYVIGTGTTDSSGSVTFWLNPDFVHAISFSKTGYETFSLAQFPTQSSYTVTLGQTSVSGLNDYIRGITYIVKPNYGMTLNASQLYNFNMTFSSTYWSLDSFGFILYGDGTVIGGNSSTNSSGGFISNILNVSSYDHIKIKIYWVVNGTTTYGENNGWFTFDYNEGTGWSIKHFFDDLSLYMDDGLFGLNQNSLNFIIFVIIFLVTGIASYKFSMQDPAMVSGLIFALVFLFDYALGLIEMPLLAVEHFPTIFIGLITFALFIWEVRR